MSDVIIISPNGPAYTLLAVYAPEDSNVNVVLYHVQNYDASHAERQFAEERCTHAYDCCGSWYCRGHVPLKDPNGHVSVIQVTYTQNI